MVFKYFSLQYESNLYFYTYICTCIHTYAFNGLHVKYWFSIEGGGNDFLKNVYIFKVPSFSLFYMIDPSQGLNLISRQSIENFFSPMGTS